jgi:hypothetical protein
MVVFFFLDFHPHFLDYSLPDGIDLRRTCIASSARFYKKVRAFTPPQSLLSGE